MTWTRLSDDFTDAPQLLNVSRSARLLHVEALVYCNRHLTDGELPRAAVPRITDAVDLEALTRELADAGLWSQLDDARWQVDWTNQELGADVRARKTQQAEKQKLYRRRKEAHGRGDHSLCDPRHCPAVTSNAIGHATGHVTEPVTPSRPDPSRPKDRGQGTGRVAASTALRSRPTPGRRCDNGHPIVADDSCCSEHDEAAS